MTSNLRLPFDADAESVDARIDARDRAGRERAVDPRFNVVLEASAGTGKTRVLVDRYINLLRAGVDPANILAITFTRKAAAEMRERIVSTLRTAAARGEFTPARWRELRDRTADIAISTIDAFCLSLLREFPLEADLDPGFSMADDAEVPRLVDESLDRSLRICRALAREDEHVALVFAQLGDRRARSGLAALLNRRIVAPAVLSRYLSKGPADLTLATAAQRGAHALIDLFESMRGGLDRFLETGPLEPSFTLLQQRLRGLERCLMEGIATEPAAVQAAFARVREHFLTQTGQPRKVLGYKKPMFASAVDYQVHRDLVVDHAPAVLDVHRAYRRDLNVLVSRGVWRMFRVAEDEYRRTLLSHAVLDFSELLLRAVGLLRQMEEFAQSRYRLESRYHHVLVDEFQDTSRAQWELIALLIESWGEGAGLAHSGPLQPSIFIVGDRKQSIYAFRDAEVSVLREAGRHLEALRPDGDVRRSISRSFRAVPQLLSFVNDLCHDIAKLPERRDAFQYAEEDRFPLDGGAPPAKAIGHHAPDPLLVVGDTPEACAETTAAEIARLIAEGTVVRDRDTGIARPVRAGDIAVLFRTRESHREFEAALESRGIPAYVYKGLGFFDSDEIRDVLALLWYLAEPLSNLRAAAFLRSRFVQISDEGLRLLAPHLADALLAPEPPTAAASLDGDDRRELDAARAATAGWRALVDRVPPAELLDRILQESAYVVEMRGARFAQARENVKKIRAMIRRIQNRGYATLGRIVAHLDRLAVGDEASAVIDASDAVNLMTVHAAKGLEFPVVFVVNLARGTGNRRPPIRIASDPSADTVSVAVGDFQSEADEDDAAREQEETKRLLYVALTRARDRLYLGSVLKDGRMQPGRGSLAEVLPPSLVEAFDRTAGATEVEWCGASGAVYRLGVCAPAEVFRLKPEATSDESQAYVVSGFSRTSSDDFAPLQDSSTPRRSVASITEETDASLPSGLGDESNRLVGTLVHRVLQRIGMMPQADDGQLRELVATLMKTVDAAAPFTDTAVIDDVVASYHALSSRADVCDLYSAGEVMHEVPFTLSVDGAIVRGTIDCLVRGRGDADRIVTVLEFKTGRPRPEHAAQVEIYRRAAQALFPDAAVDARLVYSGDASAVT